MVILVLATPTQPEAVVTITLIDAFSLPSLIYVGLEEVGSSNAPWFVDH